MMKTVLMMAFGLIALGFCYRIFDVIRTAKVIEKLKSEENDHDKIKINVSKEVILLVTCCFACFVVFRAYPDQLSKQSAISTESFITDSDVMMDNALEEAVYEGIDVNEDVALFLEEQGYNPTEMKILDSFEERFINKCIASEIINDKIYQLYCDEEEYVILVSDVINSEAIQ